MQIFWLGYDVLSKVKWPVMADPTDWLLEKKKPWIYEKPQNRL
jgi:hypothetical protein